MNKIEYLQISSWRTI